MKNKILSGLVFFLVVISTVASSGSSSYDAELFPHRADVQDYIQQMAQQHHFPQEQLVKLFAQVHRIPFILARKKPAAELTWQQYRDAFLRSNERVKNGVLFWQKHHEALKRAEQVYGVPPHVIVAIIGIESDYGKYLGHYKVFEALSNLAFSDSERRHFFRDELTAFLLLCRERDLEPWSVLGAYDGGIGQPQFMPSSFRTYAVDFSHHGKIDLTSNDEDVIGSIANYLKENGWHRHELLAIPARRTVDHGLLKLETNILKEQYIHSQLLNEHIRPRSPIAPDQKVGLISLTEERAQDYWIGLHNFYVVTHYNHRIYYGMIVYELSEKIKETFENSKSFGQNRAHHSVT